MRPSRILGFRPTGYRVVIADSQHGNPGLLGVLHQLAWAVKAITVMGMSMQVNHMEQNSRMAKKQSSPNRSRTPHSKKFLKFISEGWANPVSLSPKRWEVASYAAERRQALADKFRGKVLVIEAGEPKVRSNDTEYRYRAHSAFSHLTGWGNQTVPGSVLVIDARNKKAKSTLYLMPTAGRNSSEFFANPMIGEFWVGQRPTLKDVEVQLDVPTKDLAALPDLKKKYGRDLLTLQNSKLAEAVSVLRFVKDKYEISEMRKAVAATVRGFEDVVRELPKALISQKGERVVETTFFARARLDGNDLGYETISASGSNACILHWTRNDGKINKDDLLLLDAGVEVDSLYTADVTRTLPVSGKFSDTQKKLYEIVLEAADAAFAVAKPGVRFKEVHEAAMQVIAKRTAELGILPVSGEESLDPKNQHHRRWMVHGTSHHLGLDVHDCAQAKRELYLEAKLEPGMIFTIEPGLYFHADDTLVPKSLRGIGIRIEDDVLVTKSGVENLSKALPRTVSEIESWMSQLSAGSAG